jgi:hypothetical protein
VVVLSAAGLLALPAPRPALADAGCSSGGTCVIVDSWLSGTEQTSTLTGEQVWDSTQAPPDVGSNGSVTYAIRNSHGDGPAQQVSNGVSIKQLLTTNLGLSLPSGVLVAVPRTTDVQTWSTLQGDEVNDPESTFEGGLKPVLWRADGEVNYLRPLTSASDVNSNDFVSTPSSDDPLTIDVFTSQLQVDVKGPAGRVAPKAGATFTATASGSSAADPVHYTWTFDDGSTDSGAQVTHSWSQPGRYLVLATAVGQDGSGGSSQPVTVQVAAPAKQPPPTHRPNPGGGTNPDPTHPSTGPVKSRGQQQGGAPGSKPGRGTGGGNGNGSFTLPSFGTLSLNRLPSSRLQSDLSGQQPQVAGQATVSGRVIGPTASLSLAAAASEASGSASAPAAVDASDEASRVSPTTVPIYVAVVLALLGIGYGRERGWLARLRGWRALLRR